VEKIVLLFEGSMFVMVVNGNLWREIDA